MSALVLFQCFRSTFLCRHTYIHAKMIFRVFIFTEKDLLLQTETTAQRYLWLYRHTVVKGIPIVSPLYMYTQRHSVSFCQRMSINRLQSGCMLISIHGIHRTFLPIFAWSSYESEVQVSCGQNSKGDSQLFVHRNGFLKCSVLSSNLLTNNV